MIKILEVNFAFVPIKRPGLPLIIHAFTKVGFFHRSFFGEIYRCKS